MRKDEEALMDAEGRLYPLLNESSKFASLDGECRYWVEAEIDVEPPKTIVGNVSPGVSDFSNKYQTLWVELHSLLDASLENEDERIREYVVTRLNDEFRFLDHLYGRRKKNIEHNDP